MTSKQAVATETPVAAGGYTLQCNRTFLRASAGGLLDSASSGDTGLFHRGTRFLSRLDLRFGDVPLRLLDASVDDDNLTLVIDLTNPDLDTGTGSIPADAMHLRRMIILADGELVERAEITNYGLARVAFDLIYSIDADFADVFEARGMRRARRGVAHPPQIDGERLCFRYDGLDRIGRTMTAALDTPGEPESDGFRFSVSLDPGASRAVEISIRCAVGSKTTAPTAFRAVRTDRLKKRGASNSMSAFISTSSALYDAWIDQSARDLRMLTIETEHGPYPAAGAPWYVTTFGRDGIITALQMLDIQPALAAGVLRYLAAHQATEVDTANEAQPGKIVHEMREGEMANLGEHRFARYYGTVDATPLFVMLAGAYYRRTADLNLVRELWPNIQAALSWIDSYGDVDGDGFVEYHSDTADGLVQQGWKDSHDSVFHADGSAALSPIALCEVQGYVYAGKLAAADLAEALGARSQAVQFRQQAGRLRERFNQTFWDDDLGSFVLALDGDKRPCRIVTSNAGHCLYSGIAEPELAARQAERFCREDMASGWGLRTLSTRANRYNPLSYHNGSIWPHDNAIIAAGLSRYGRSSDVLRLHDELTAAATRMEMMRLPELYCGFLREPEQGPDHGPVRYPISCTPQAWAAGSVFMLLSACLGIRIDAPKGEIIFSDPRLPAGRNDWIDRIDIDRLRVGEAVVDVSFERVAGAVKMTSVQRSGPEIEIRLE